MNRIKRLSLAAWLIPLSFISAISCAGARAGEGEKALSLQEERARVMAAYRPDAPFPGSAFAEIEGYRLHYLLSEPRLAEGRAALGQVLLVHGFGSSVYCWRFLAPALADAGYRVIAVDWPPFGYSEAPSGETEGGADSRARLLWKFADLFGGREGWIIVGHSLGGRISAWMSAMRPGDVDGLVLIAPAIYAGNRSLGLLQNPFLHSVVHANLDSRILDPVSIRAMLDRAAGQKSGDADFEAYWAPFLRPGTRERLSSWLAVASESRSPPLAAITAPTLIIWGSADAIVKPEGKRLAAEIPGSRALDVEGSGHLVMETSPGRVNSAILGFLGGK